MFDVCYVWGPWQCKALGNVQLLFPSDHCFRLRWRPCHSACLLFPSYSDDAVVAHSQPTNNLDLEAVVALADAVESFEGGVVVVSTGGGAKHMAG